MKVCGKCKLELAFDAFHKAAREKSGYQQWCKTCRKGHDREGRLAYHRNRYHTDKATWLNHQYKRTYGITLQEYNTMSEEQKHVCVICNSTCSSGRRLAVDHCHTTGKVRGLLCGNCNKGLGDFQDSTELLENAIKYLKEKYL